MNDNNHHKMKNYHLIFCQKRNICRTIIMTASSAAPPSRRLCSVYAVKYIIFVEFYKFGDGFLILMFWRQNDM